MTQTAQVQDRATKLLCYERAMKKADEVSPAIPEDTLESIEKQKEAKIHRFRLWLHAGRPLNTDEDKEFRLLATPHNLPKDGFEDVWQRIYKAHFRDKQFDNDLQREKKRLGRREREIAKHVRNCSPASQNLPHTFQM